MKIWHWLMVATLAAAPGHALAGDAEIIQLSPGVYMSIVKNYAGAFGQMSTTKKKAILAANEYAAERGMEAVPVGMETREARPGQWPAAEYQFRLVAKGSGETVGLRPDADTRVTIEGDGAGQSAANKPDLYTELMKLDDLRKRGLLSDQEFEAQKAKLLAQ